jgi:hypothetical protein
MTHQELDFGGSKMNAIGSRSSTMIVFRSTTNTVSHSLKASGVITTKTSMPLTISTNKTMPARHQLSQNLTFVRQVAKRRECVGAISGAINVQGWGAIASVRESWAVDFPPRSKKCGMPQKTTDPKAGGDARGRG